MADFSTLIASIEETIKTNGVQAITGQILQDEMLLMVSAINQLKQDTLEGYAFYGQVLADGGSASVTQNTFFLVTAGTYTINGNTFTVTGEGVSVVVYDSVNDEVLNEGLILPFDNAPISGSTNPITSGAVAAALAENPANFAACLYDRRSAGTPQSPYAFRQSGGDGVDYLKRIKGRTLVWNQLVQIPATSSTRTGQGLTITDNRDGTYTINGTSTSGAYFEFADTGSLYLNTGHKHFWACFLLSGTISGSAYVGDGYMSDDVECGSAVILDAVRAERRLFMKAADGVVFTNAKIAPMCIDLTLLGWVPSSVSEFRAVYPLSYYAYNAGALINNAATALESTGFNQWDEEWEEGILDDTTGERIPYANRWRTKNFIPCTRSTDYYFRNGGIGSLYVFEYDAAQNFIRYTAISNAALTTQAETHFLKFYPAAGYGATYANNICINLSDASRNGTYEPYWKATRHLGLDNLQAKEVGSDTIVTINGLDGVGDNVDLLKEGKYIEKNRARVDLGDLTWTYDSNSQVFYAPISDAKLYTSSMGASPQINTKGYVSVFSIVSATDKSIAVNTSGQTTGRIYVKDSAYSDAAAFKTAMAGVMLDYPLATPKEYELVEPIQPMLEVDELGTERRLPEDTADAVNAPFESDSNYSVSVANLVRKLSE